MPDKYKKHEFRLTADCGRFLYALCEALKNAGRQYGDGIVMDIRTKAEDMMFLIDRANRMKAGSIPRLQSQYKAIAVRDEIQLLLDPACRLAEAGIKKQGQLERMIEDIKQPLQNWYISDLKRRAEYAEHTYRKTVKSYEQAAEDEKAVKNYSDEHPSERITEALDMAQSVTRVRYRQMTDAQQELDKAQMNLYSKMTKDYTLLADVLKKIEEEKADNGRK